MNLPRIMGLPEDLQHVHNYEMKIANENNTDIAANIIPTRESRNKNRSHQNTQAEEAKEIAYVEQNNVINLN